MLHKLTSRLDVTLNCFKRFFKDKLLSPFIDKFCLENEILVLLYGSLDESIVVKTSHEEKDDKAHLTKMKEIQPNVEQKSL